MEEEGSEGGGEWRKRGVEEVKDEEDREYEMEEDEEVSGGGGEREGRRGGNLTANLGF